MTGPKRVRVCPYEPETTDTEPPADTATAPVVEALVVESIKPVQRSTVQDEALLAAIRADRHNPLALPKNDPGKAGIKSAIRKKLVGVNPIFPKDGTQFEKAWHRLRSTGEIADKL